MALSKHPAAVASRKRRRRYRAELIKMLGGKCKKCGAETKLEPHHISPRTWQSREKWAITRLLIYLREAREGAVVLLCRGCNASLNFPQNGDSDNF